MDFDTFNASISLSKTPSKEVLSVEIDEDSPEPPQSSTTTEVTSTSSSQGPSTSLTTTLISSTSSLGTSSTSSDSTITSSSSSASASSTSSSDSSSSTTFSSSSSSWSSDDGHGSSSVNTPPPSGSPDVGPPNSESVPPVTSVPPSQSPSIPSGSPAQPFTRLPSPTRKAPGPTNVVSGNFGVASESTHSAPPPAGPSRVAFATDDTSSSYPKATTSHHATAWGTPESSLQRPRPTSLSGSGAVIAAAPSVDLDSLTDISGSSLSTQIFTTTFRTTLPFGSGTVSPGQVVDVTQTSTRIVPIPTGSDSAAATNTTQASPRAAAHSSATLLAAILVPILVTLLVVLPCLLLLVRLRRRGRVRFMADYGLISAPPEQPYSIHRRSVESMATTRDSQYDMCSVPDAAMVHTDLLPRIYESQGRTVASGPSQVPAQDPFADNPEDELRAPLFVQTDVPPSNSDGRGLTSPSPNSSNGRSASNPGWRAFSPTTSLVDSLHRAASRLGARSPSRTEFPNSTSEIPVDPLSPMLYKNVGRTSQSDDPFADADWDHMDDPFANLNARSLELDDAARSSAGRSESRSGHTGILNRIRGK